MPRRSRLKHKGWVMIVRRISLGAALVAAGGVFALPSTALAANGPVCDAYSHHCTHVIPRHIVRPPTEVKGEKTVLPFTGAELVAMTVVGGGALGAGTAFVIAGRRRRSTTA